MSNDNIQILVVDDNPATLYSTSRILRSVGWRVIEATSGEEGFARASQGVDVVVLDVNLPDVDGFTICRRLRAQESTANLPIVHLSATFVTSESKVHGLEAGADGYLTHPVEPPVLIATVKAFLRARQAELESRQSEARFKSLFENALNGVSVIDRQLKFVDVNSAFCRILQVTRDQLVGSSLIDLVPGDWRPEVTPILHQLDRNVAWHGEFPLLRSDGELKYLDWHFSLHTTHEFRLATATDISLRVKYEEEREALLLSERTARAEAEDANRLKDDFLATLSHELRTPLSAIVGWSQVLRIGESSPEEVLEGLEAIERNAVAQSQMIADLLDVSRITSGKIRLDLQLIDPRALLEAAIAAILPLARKKSIRISKVFATDTGPVEGDPARLQQVLWNLINNAVKFTPENGKVSVTLARRDSVVEIRVSDNGQGIAEELVPLIFERFRQEDASSTREHGGLGLGLAIARQLVELHGGVIRAESPGKGLGATFSIDLPPSSQSHSASSIDAVSEQVEPGHPSRMSLEGVRVLCVEDDADSLAILRRVLTGFGAKVIEANRASTALELLAASEPDIMISDLGMPVMDGFALIREIRASGHSPQQLPAIALTAFARPEDRRRCLLAGFQVHLSKPVDPHELTSTVLSLVGRPAHG